VTFRLMSFIGIFACLIVGCTLESATPTSDPITPTLTAQIDVTRTALAQNAYTPIPTVILITATPSPTVTSTFTPLPTNTQPPTATMTYTPTLTMTATATATYTLTPLPTETPILTPTLVAGDHYKMSRPIARDDELSDWVDRTYAYGDTQQFQRETHLGVEFFNRRFTPVRASANGFVIFAGMDNEEQWGPRLNYYGNLVVVEHQFTSPASLPVYTLYAHLEDIRVEVGDVVGTGDVVGRVGDSGIAIGPHLHYEVRVGDVMNYLNTRNPELWIKPYNGFGTFAGRVVNEDGLALQSTRLMIRADNFIREFYTYADDTVNSDTYWNENFVIGDLPQGTYEVFINAPNGSILLRQTIEIFAGATTFETLVLE